MDDPVDSALYAGFRGSTVVRRTEPVERRRRRLCVVDGAQDCGRLGDCVLHGAERVLGVVGDVQFDAGRDGDFQGICLVVHFLINKDTYYLGHLVRRKSAN